MSLPNLPLWNKDDTDVLPQFQMTFGHVLFDGVADQSTFSKAFKLLNLGKPLYHGEIQEVRIPRLPSGDPVLSGNNETHFIVAKSSDTWAMFGPHVYYLNSKNWILLNKRLGRLMAFITQIDIDSDACLIFQSGSKETNVFIDEDDLRIVPDAPVAAYIEGKKIFEDKSVCSLSDTKVSNFIGKDLVLKIDGNKKPFITHRFSNQAGLDFSCTHFIFGSPPAKKRFFGIL